MVYLKTNGTANVGDKFYIYQDGDKEVMHPATKKKMGYVIEILGIAEVTKFEYGRNNSKNLESFKDIMTGDILDTFSEMEPPVVPKPFRMPDIDGYVVATKHYA